MTKTIRIDGVIGTGPGEVSAAWVREQLPKNGADPIDVRIHSEGGSVFEGFAIHDIFASYAGPKTASIESSAFSIASFILLAFDDVTISSNGYIMLHSPYISVEGDDEELTKQADLLGKLKLTMVSAYARRSGRTEDEIAAMLRQETYLNAEQAVAMRLATRIAGQPVIGRAFAKLSNMPHGVVAALFGAGSGGNNDSTKGSSMSESKPVAATVQEIKAAFPKAKSDFIVRCLEKSLPLASVATAAAEELVKENEELQAKVKALEEAVAKAKAENEAKAKEDDEADKKEEPAAHKSGVAPVAKSKSGAPSARARWNEAVAAAVARVKDKSRAVALANRENPGLRLAMLAEVNAR